MQPDLTADTAAAKPALKLRAALLKVAGISPAGFVMIGQPCLDRFGRVPTGI